MMKEVISFLIWYTLMMRRKELSDLFRNVCRLGDTFDTHISKMAVTIGEVLTLFVLIGGWLAKIVLYEECDCKLLVAYNVLNAFTLPEGYNCKLFYVITLFNNSFLNIMKTFLAVIYTIICHFLRTILKAHSNFGYRKTQKSKATVHYVTIECHLLRYESILKVLKHFERTLAFPVFLLQIADLVGLFIGFIWIDASKSPLQHWFRNYWLPVYFNSLVSLVSFLCVSLTASSVHEASKECKNVQEIMLKQVLASNRKEDFKTLTLLLVAHQSPPFILSAWGFFYFSKGLVLVALGSVMTYSLLIIQISLTR
ncbi:uncharacterized protein CDAR_563881 [Caerostris darwini]|uniref:Gustatory receptor n=1 Tax=Caerostris darwini TaxID=1538125 RepID=A0AAV4UYE1_9ARAC|nr:uncharacterized protein CDAR_563881 [Caerostris darwini]